MSMAFWGAERVTRTLAPVEAMNKARINYQSGTLEMGQTAMRC
jgi:hypothetical protein